MGNNEAKFQLNDSWSTENKILAGLLIIACLSKLLIYVDVSFWLDEQISIGIASEGPFSCIPATLRFSAHPPAYYCQLGLWMLFDKGDFWVISNAIFLNILTVFVAYKVFRKRYSLSAALFASLTLALLPQFTYYATNVRMYSWIIMFSILCWNLTEKIFDNTYNRAGSAVTNRLRWRMVCMLLLGYAHAIGPIYAAMQGLYALWLAKSEANKKISIQWFKYEILTGILLIPVVINGAFRETQHTNTDNTFELVKLFAQNFVSDVFPASIYSWVAVVVSALIISLTWFVRSDKHELKKVIVLIFAQILFFLLISVLLKPILSSRGLVVVLPVFSLLVGIAYAKANLSNIAKTSIVFIWFGALGFGSYQMLVRYEKPNDYASAVADLANRVEANEEIYVYAGSTTWGVTRAMMGPDWVSSLAIQAPANERWVKVEEALGEYCSVIRICAETNQFRWLQNQVHIFHNTMEINPKTKRIWVIVNAGQDISYFEKQLQNAGYRALYKKNHNAELVRLFEQKVF